MKVNLFLLLPFFGCTVNSSNGSSVLNNKRSKNRHADLVDPGSNDVLPPASVTVSPECWRMATAVVQKTHQHYAADATQMCEMLPEAHQKRLALEIARCHLQDLGRPLYRSSAAERECTGSNVDHDTVQMCLKQLTDSGENAYTQYISYVQILCIQLTQELLLQYQQSVKDEVATKYAELSGQSVAHMEVINNQMQTISEIPAILQDQLTRELKQQLKESLDEQLRDRISELLQNQASEQATFLGNIMDHLELRDVEHQSRVNDWTTYQTTLWQKQAREMEGQRAAMDEQRVRMELLSRTVSETTQNMQPLVGLQSFIQMATEGYTWITFLLHFLGTFNIVWVITRPQRCHPFRSYLYGLVLGEAVLEFALTTAVQYELLSEVGRVACITDLRRWALFVECITYVFGLMASCVVSKDTKRSNRRNALALHDERKGDYDERLEYEFEAAHHELDAYPQSDQHTQYESVAQNTHDARMFEDHRPLRILDHGRHEPTYTVAERADHHHCHDHRVRQSSNSSHNRSSDSHRATSSLHKLAVFHHRPPMVVQGKDYREHTPKHDHISCDDSSVASHQHRQPMLFPPRLSKQDHQHATTKIAPSQPNVNPHSPPGSHRHRHHEDEALAALVVTPVDKEDNMIEDVNYVDALPSPKSATGKRPATAEPEEEPSPKKTACGY